MSSKEPTAGRWAEAAGRLVMEAMQSEWEPLSHNELDQRLDQAVEEILEAELMSGVQGGEQGLSGDVFMQLSQQDESIPHTVTSHTSAPAVSFLCHVEVEPAPEYFQHITEIEQNPTVQYITSLLQKLKWSQSRRRLTGRAHLSLSHTVFLSLTLLTTRLSYRSVSSTFHLEKGNLHRIFFSFCHRVNTLQPQLLRWPTGQEVLDLLLPFSSWLGCDEKLKQEGLPKVFGILGHTRIPIRLPASKQDSESASPHARQLRMCPHSDSWLILELVCNAEGRFIHCSISRGSRRNRGDTLSQRLAEHPELLPHGSCLLAGAGYPLTKHILTPFCPARNPQENLYNRTVEMHLRRLEQAVAELKERFGRLRYLDMGKRERAEAVVLTCCILHNALLHSGCDSTVQGENDIGVDLQEEQEEEGTKEEAGVRLREKVAHLLYSAAGVQ